jgi:hypothetical protein
MYISYRITPFQFSYWLQGAIEIGGLTDFTPKQLETIVRRIGELTAHDAFTFAVLASIRYCAGHKDLFSVINQHLQAKFLHEIDPTYEGDQEFLLAVHRGDAEPEAKT